MSSKADIAKSLSTQGLKGKKQLRKYLARESELAPLVYLKFIRNTEVKQRKINEYFLCICKE